MAAAGIRRGRTGGELYPGLVVEIPAKVKNISRSNIGAARRRIVSPLFISGSFRRKRCSNQWLKAVTNKEYNKYK